MSNSEGHDRDNNRKGIIMVTINNQGAKNLPGSNKDSRRFVRFPSWVLDAPVVNTSTQSVYLVLIDYTSKNQDVVWPSVATIARRSKMSERQARRSLRLLEDLGMITTERQPSHGSNRYTVVELSDADITRIQGVNENALTSDDAKLRGSDLGADSQSSPSDSQSSPSDLQSSPSDSQSSPGGLGGQRTRPKEPEPGNQNQGTRTNSQNQRCRAGGAEYPDQEIEMTQEPRTGDETGLHARLKRIAAKGEASVTPSEDLGRRLAERMTFERIPGGHPRDTERRRREFDKMRQRHGLGEAKSSMLPMVSLSDLAGDGPQEPLAEDTSTPTAPKFQKLWDTPEAKKTAAKREGRKRQESLGASEGTEPTWTHQNTEIVAQEQAKPQQRPLNFGSDGLDHDFLAEMMNYTDPALLEMERV